ncbi:NAD(P)/FAD-dependent oxidoreductase [Methylocella sp. CPCC 101449]|uniref:NAD(P)/FAD-dependent oxidoreductase n=1 Tax=Methylocella sp. CPCC 101449 TaxID=2987531 RepID=UPI0028916916|nr:NAD(P)/FAD-dependent oxidoreductase [Methylocella sp. CPCC 101449]MDT2023276.1 NAD(P)/FAD-dependent oxidoreductase [Methylocella sp. CPCC 101449]
MNADIDCLVIGAGVIGLAIARALARAGREVVVVERERAVGQGASSRNSEVIHAGIYYAPGSLKARLCVEGRQRLYRFCADHHVPHARCGKIIVAASAEQRDTLLAITARAHANGATDVREIGRDEMKAMEPEIEGVMGLASPSTGIVDTHALMLALEGDAAMHGASTAFATPFLGASRAGEHLRVRLGGDEACDMSVNTCVLAAGLASPRLAHMIEGIARDSIPQPHFAKGNYFTLGRRSPFSRLIYPVPEPGGLGTHLTIDLAGRARFGPDVEWLDTQDDLAIDYAVDPARANKFYRAIRRYWPGLQDGELLPDYSGVRPKIVPQGAAEADFMVQGQDVHGVRGLVALYGIESPGLTSALAIAERVADMVAAEANA